MADFNMHTLQWNNFNWQYATYYEYDFNGNLLFLQRKFENMAMEYRYETNRNRLLHVHDIYSSEVYSIPSHNLNGDLSVDYGASVYINRNASGRPTYIDAPFGDMYLNYNSMGQRQVKSGSGTGMYYYIHDATGNVMAVYQRKFNKNLYDSLFIQERGIYGSSRLGLNTEEFKVTLPRNVKQRIIGKRQFELTDHLGNVNAVVSDRKQYNGTPLYISWNDYYPFGYPINDRSGNIVGYRFGFNGQEKDDEIYGIGKSFSFEFRQYDARLGKWWGIDPLAGKYPFLSPYVFVANNPIILVDSDGRKIVFAKGASSEFKAAFKAAIQHLNKNNAGGIAAHLEKSKITYYIAEKTEGNSYFKPSTQTVYWNPSLGLETDEGHTLSPTTILNHELGHVLILDLAYMAGKMDEYNAERVKGSDPDYETKNEKYVITRIEQKTAKALGEIKEGEITRKNHKGKDIQTEGPTSNQPKATTLPEIIIEPNK